MPPRPATLRVATAVAWLVAWLVAAALCVAACSGGSGGGSNASPSGTAPRPMPVIASFYPLEYAVAKVGGSRVAVSSLTEPGVEPHDLELTAQDVAAVGAASLVVYLGGLQPAVDAVVSQRSAAGFDVAQAAALDLPRDGDSSGTGSGEPDLHFWLDPIRLAGVGTAIAERLAAADPSAADEYRANANAFAAELGRLDEELRAGLGACANRQLVTTHAAFAYLARRYGLTQVPIAGSSPDEEPTARQLADVAATVRDTAATTVYAETLVDDRFAQTVAASTGATVAVLDPVEGVTPASPGSDYAEIMRADLAVLRSGQGCR